jgi:uncharacterized protein (DUF58 family)
MKTNSEFRQPERLRTEFTREGGYYVLVLAFVLTGAMLRDINLMMVIAGVMVGLWAYNWRKAATTLRKLGVRRVSPEAICAGDTLVVDVALSNQSRRANKRGVLVQDSLQRLVGRNAVEGTTGRVVFERVAPGRLESRGYQGRIWTRGRYELGPLEVSCRFPFGLMRCRGKVDDRHTLTVFPRLGRLTPAWAHLHDDALVGSLRMRRQQTQTEGDFYGLRDWREGDSHRWIHWRTSARRGKPVVRQYERQRRQDMVLLVELWQPVKPAPMHVDAVEIAVSFAATIVADLCRRGGSQLHLVIGGHQQEALRGVASQGLLSELMSALALARAKDADLLPQIANEGLSAAPRNARLLVISTRPADIAAIAARLETSSRAAYLLTQMRSTCFDCSSHHIDEYFTLD